MLRSIKFIFNSTFRSLGSNAFASASALDFQGLYSGSLKYLYVFVAFSTYIYSNFFQWFSCLFFFLKVICLEFSFILKIEISDFHIGNLAGK